MKSKKVYIGISIIAVIVICIVSSIFYIKATKDVKQAEFSKNITNEDTKEAMNISEDDDNAKEITNEENVVVEENKESVEENVVEENKDSVKENTVEKKKTETAEVAKKETTTKKEFSVTDMSKTLYVKATSLNVRSGPETTYSKIGSLKNASEVTITGKVNGLTWYRIYYNGKVGYVDGTYLSETKPVVETTPKVEEKSADVSTADGTVLENLIIINSRNNTLRYYCGGTLSRSYSCATGASSSPTPQGKFTVYNKIVNRPYYKANIPGGDPRNPLGKRWIGLDINGTKGSTYGIHGTNNEGSIGSNASHGCIRMHNADVESFYDIVPIGTTVIIKNTSQSDKQIAAGYGIYID